MDEQHKPVVRKFSEELDRGPLSFETIQEAITSISEELNIGCVYGEIFNSANKNENKAIDDYQYLYTNRNGYDDNEKIEIPFRSISGADGKYNILAKTNHKFDDSEKEAVEDVFHIIDSFIAKIVANEQIEEIATHQKFTGLLNVDGYSKRIRKIYAQGKADLYDAIYFNISAFGLLNRKYDRRTGDLILIEFGKQVSRYIDDDEVFGQLGGDNFVAFVKKENFKKFITAIKARNITVIGANDKEVNVTLRTRIGYMHMQKNTPKDEVVGGPAIALNAAKINRKQIVELTDNLKNKALYDKDIEQSFEKSLLNKEFLAYYQPKVDVRNNEIIGAEALARWNRNNEIVFPDAFIQTLEKVGRIVELDLYMLETVCKDVVEWKKKGLKTVPISVNFSRRDLSDFKLAEYISEIISKYGLSKEEIVVEITETTFEDEVEQLTCFINGLSNCGVRVSVDDFGTGYSSLSLISEYPVNEIKIDRSFINKKLNKKDEVIVSGIIDIAKKLNLEIISEGVESNEQKEFLLKVGCNRAQGFLFDKPLPKEKFETKLKKA